ncbi:MAG: hypothetical protein QGH59_02090 [Gemmatimonadota bacterium]|nr:hypothetical protein [Gemmatimonadota bacterium]MDP6460541.1 hypothetical protein [Gemmatimonadota bacterium]
MTENTENMEKSEATQTPAAVAAPPVAAETASPVDPVSEAPEPEEEEAGLPKPHERTTREARKIGLAVEGMLESSTNPYEVVVTAAQEARRINAKIIHARSLIQQMAEEAAESVPEVPFVPRPVEDEEPETKVTTEALERLAIDMVSYEVDGERHEGQGDPEAFLAEDDEESGED